MRGTVTELLDSYGATFGAVWVADPDRLLAARRQVLADLAMVVAVPGGLLALPLLASTATRSCRSANDRPPPVCSTCDGKTPATSALPVTSQHLKDGTTVSRMTHGRRAGRRAGPPPRMDRFRPTRCGIINLWDYRDEEFVFADGRMVLRGPNGSGKTKALEVLFPFVLDGRIEPRRLNPFAGEERTMKSNLLYRGQESAHAYVWMEFRRDPGRRQRTEVVTVGAGLRAQRQNDRVTRWYFVVDGQVGRDFSLLGPDDRPLTKRQLAEQIGSDAVTDRPIEHRTAIDARLFGLGGARFEQLLTLVLTLRRPQLAKNLDPKGLSRALADGLRPLDDSLIDEAAHSFGDMENVQRTLAGLGAGRCRRRRVPGRLHHLPADPRPCGLRRGGAETGRGAGFAGRTGRGAGRGAACDRHPGQCPIAAHARALQEQQALTARLASLKASPAYRDREQLGRLAEITGQLEQAARRDAQAAIHAAGESWPGGWTRCVTPRTPTGSLSPPWPGLPAI